METNFFDHYYSCRLICESCMAENSTSRSNPAMWYFDFRHDRPRHLTVIDDHTYRATAPKLSPWAQIDGWTLGTCLHDWILRDSQRHTSKPPSRLARFGPTWGQHHSFEPKTTNFLYWDAQRLQSQQVGALFLAMTIACLYMFVFDECPLPPNIIANFSRNLGCV